MQITCDVLIIGAGPAGSSAARASAGMGLQVILLEKRKQVGVPVQCAEYVPWQITQEMELTEDIIAQRIEVMQTYMPDGEIKGTQANGFIIHRDIFDQYLAKKALEAGAKLFLKTKAQALENKVVIAKNIQIKARVIIGADGPNSIVGRWINSQNTGFVHTAQYQMKLCKSLRSTKVFFHKSIPGGYGWVFPKQDLVNVGVGVSKMFKVKPQEALDKFVHYLIGKGVIKPDILNKTGGAIPVGGLVKKLQCGNVLLVGDAAGMAHPITGAGVSNAVLCGKIAGELAGRAVLQNNLDILAEYEEECRMLLDEPLMRARKKRKTMEAYWSNGNKELAKTLRSSWIAFEEYYQ